MRRLKEFILGLIVVISIAIACYITYCIVDYFICINEDEIGMKLAVGLGILSFSLMSAWIFKWIGEDVIEYIEKQKK